LKGLLLYCAEFYYYSGPSVVVVVGCLSKGTFILTYRFIKGCDSNAKIIVFYYVKCKGLE
jgi:hypothetical protein